MTQEIVVKSKETKTGVMFRIIKDGKFLFAEIPFNNYFYVRSPDWTLYKEDFAPLFGYAIKEVVEIGTFTKIIFSNNYMRQKIREWWEAKVPVFEADIKANKRYLINSNIKLHNEALPYLFYDIETDDRKPLNKDDSGRVLPGDAKILSFAAIDNFGKEYTQLLEEYTDEAEIKLLKYIIGCFSNYGIISGWNSEKFDMPYIKGRCDSLGISFDILEFVNHLDYMELFKKYDKKSRPSFSLNAISNEVLKDSKLDQPKGNGKVYNAWLTNPTYLLEYNKKDAELIYKINKEIAFIEVSMKRAENAHCHVRNTFHNSDSGDFLILRKCLMKGLVMPSQPNEEEKAKRKKMPNIGGGFTTCYYPGFHESIEIFDFKSEYPSMIESFNISPETFVEVIYDHKMAEQIDKEKFCVTPCDTNIDRGKETFHPYRVYRKDIEGVIPAVVRELVEKRDTIKYPMNKYKNEFNKDGTPNPDYNPSKYKALYLEQYALKTDGNSIYGILAFPMARYFQWHLGDSVTTSARATLKACNAMITQYGCSIIGGDTDSTFVKLNGKDIEEVNKLYVDFLDSWAKKWGARVNKLVFEHEKTYAPMFFVAKKNYAYCENGKIGIKGLQCIKADTNKFAAKLQKDFVMDVMQFKYSEEEWRQNIDNIYNKVYNQQLTSEELILIKALTQMPKDYAGFIIDKKTGSPKIKRDGTTQEKSIPAHVRLAERLIESGEEVYPGSKIKYIVIKDKPILAISPAEFEKREGVFKYKAKKIGWMDYSWSETYDANYYWKRIMKPLIKVVTSYHKELPDWSWNLSASELKKLANNDTDEEDEE